MIYCLLGNWHVCFVAIRLHDTDRRSILLFTWYFPFNLSRFFHTVTKWTLYHCNKLSHNKAGKGSLLPCIPQWVWLRFWSSIQAVIPHISSSVLSTKYNHWGRSLQYLQCSVILDAFRNTTGRGTILTSRDNIPLSQLASRPGDQKGGKNRHNQAHRECWESMLI